jgi:imidazolonepropionase-like amidohydrolase
MKAIVGGRILTITSGEIVDGIILVDQGNFVQVGKDIPIPDGASVYDVAGKVVVPGFVDAHTHLGLTEGFSETTSPVTPQVRIVDEIDLSDPGFEDAVAGGVTTVITTPGSNNVICGTSLVMKTAGHGLQQRILRDPAGMKMAWRKGTSGPRSNPPYPMSRMGIAGIMRNALLEAQHYAVRRARGEAEFDPGLDGLVRVLRRELPARVHSFTPVELQALMRIQDEFGFDFTVEHGFEAHFVAEELAARGIPVVYGPGPGCRRHKMFPDRGPHVPAILHRAGVKVSLQTDHPDRSIKELRIFGALLLRYTDLSADDVLRMLTINGAEIAGVAQRVGSIEPGKDADFAIYSGHPLRVQSRVEQVFVDGEQVLSLYTRDNDTP